MLVVKITNAIKLIYKLGKTLLLFTRFCHFNINTISLLPITLAEGNENVSVANPYKVKDYKKIDPKLGTEKEFEGLLDSFHAIKIKCLLEFDFSQTAFDHPWYKDHNEYYSKNSNDSSNTKFK